MYRLAQANCNFMSLRGNSARSMDLADIHSLALKDEGPSSCVAVLSTLDNGKTNRFGRIEYGACLRNIHPMICPHGALAMFLYYRFHVSGEPFPDIRENKKWFNTKLLKTASRCNKCWYGNGRPYLLE